VRVCALEMCAAGHFHLAVIVVRALWIIPSTLRITPSEHPRLTAMQGRRQIANA